MLKPIILLCFVTNIIWKYYAVDENGVDAVMDGNTTFNELIDTPENPLIPYYELTENEWYLLANICRGDEEILIEYINQSEQTINLHLKNKTCNHNYGTIGSITVNFSV